MFRMVIVGKAGRTDRPGSDEAGSDMGWWTIGIYQYRWCNSRHELMFPSFLRRKKAQYFVPVRRCRSSRRTGPGRVRVGSEPVNTDPAHPSQGRDK